MALAIGVFECSQEIIKCMQHITIPAEFVGTHTMQIQLLVQLADKCPILQSINERFAVYR